jgi:uncharacterized protein (DUF3084 family)
MSCWSGAANEAAQLQAKLAAQAEELRMLRANAQDNSGLLQAQLKELQEKFVVQVSSSNRGLMVVSKLGFQARHTSCLSRHMI